MSLSTAPQERRVDATVRLDADRAPSALHANLLATPRVQEAVVAAVQDAGRDRTLAALLDVLEDADVGVVDGRLVGAAARVAAGERRAVWTLLTTLRGLGRTVGATTLADARDALGALLGLSDTAAATPTVAVDVPQSFWERRASQRRAVCRWVAALATGADVVLEAGPVDLRRLHQEHRADLPRVSDWPDAPGMETPASERVADAVGSLDPEGTAVAILNELAATETATLPYQRLYSSVPVGDSRVRQVLGDLAERGLVATFRGDGGRGHLAELLPAGETVTEEIPRQRRLEDAVSQTGKPATDSRVHRAHEAAGEDWAEAATAGDRHRMPQEQVPVAWMDRARAAAAAGSAPGGGIALVDHPVPKQDDRREPAWSWDADRRELVVGAEVDNPLTLWVSLARALAAPRTWDRVLTRSALEAVDVGDDVVRDARCVGWWSDDLNGYEDIREAFIEAREHLQELIGDLRREDYEDRDRFRGEIVRLALGLMGSMTHLLDLVDVDVVREVRIPRLPTMDSSTRRDVAESLAVGTAICSRYGHHALFRRLYERREDKRETAMPVQVDAADPTGEVLGRTTVVAPGADRLQDDLEAALEEPRPLHDDAPEISVRIPVDAEAAGDRRRYARTVSRILDEKNLRPTRRAVGLLTGLSCSPYAAAAGLSRGLSPEGDRREIALDEVRRALATVPAGHLLPEQAPTVRDVVAALLESDRPLDRQTLASRAGRSVRSLRSHLDELLALGLVDEVAGGLRVALPRRDERYDAPETVLPWWVAGRDDDARPATVEGVVASVLDDVVEDPVDRRDAHRALAGEVTLAPILEAVPWLARWLPVVEALEADGPPPDALPTPPVVRLGARPAQTALEDGGEGPLREEASVGSGPRLSASRDKV